MDELILAEPDRHMSRVLRRKLGETAPARSELVQAPAESLPFPDSSFDCVTCTMVLCTVPEPADALAEVARVLKPGGRFLFLEHVRSEDPGFTREGKTGLKNPGGSLPTAATATGTAWRRSKLRR